MPHVMNGRAQLRSSSTLSTNGPISDAKEPGRKPPRPKKPNYNFIHRHPLPVEIHPLPPLFPHNPLSVLAVALSYLAQLLNPPSRPVYNGYFSSATSSIHVTDEKTAQSLWQMGFFGKGSLSRSEPSWLAKEQKKGETSEEVTGQRRNERKLFKLERARKEQQDIASKLHENLSENVHTGYTLEHTTSADHVDLGTGNAQSAAEAKEETVKSTAKAPAEDVQGRSQPRMKRLPPLNLPMNSIAEDGITVYDELADQPSSLHSERLPAGFVAKRQLSNGNTKAVRFSPTIEAREFDLSSPVVSPLKNPGPTPLTEQVEVPRHEVSNQEHLQLSLEEAFFLAYGLGVLQIYCDGSDTVLDSLSLLSLFRRHSYFPPHSLSVPAVPDDPFLISYVTYHHFRSLGWVVRSGVKFSVDYLLYNRGPAFSHAEFAVVILPSYSDPYWAEASSKAIRDRIAIERSRTWSWLHGINRVQTQVRKSLVLCYVDVPPPLKALLDSPSTSKTGDMNDIGALLKRYRVREINVRRWTPNRTRD